MAHAVEEYGIITVVRLAHIQYFAKFLDTMRAHNIAFDVLENPHNMPEFLRCYVQNPVGLPEPYMPVIEWLRKFI